MKGGTDPYLSEVDRARFFEIIDDAVENASCISTTIARQLAHQLACERVKKARFILREAGSEELAADIDEPEQPCKTWLKAFCASKDIKIVAPRELDHLRRTHCDSAAIESFLNEFAALFDCNPRLIFNMDETSIYSRKRFKVLCRAGRIPLS